MSDNESNEKQYQLNLERQNALLINEISERKKVEEELLEQKRFFEQMFSQSSVSTQILDKDGWCERINPRLSELFGVKPEAIEGKKYNIFKDKAIIRGGILPHLEKVFQEGNPAEWDICFDIGLADDSQQIQVAEKMKMWFHSRAYPVFDDKGQVLHVIIQHTDITERKQSEEQIIQLSQAVKQSPSTVVITDLDGNIEYVNPKFTETTGYSSEEALLKNPRILKSNETKSEEYKELWETITSGKEWRGEFHNKRKNGELYWEFASISPIRNTEGAITHFLAIKEDITDRKQAEIQLQKYAEELQVANDTKDKFFSIIAHDLKSPFSGIIGLSQYLKEEALELDRESIAEYAGLVNSAIVQTYRLLENLLEWARLQRGGITFNPTPFLVSEVVSEVFGLLAENASQKDIILINDIPDNQEIVADINMFTTIIRNLVSNAIKFSPFNKIVKVQSFEKNSSFKIAVIDQGNGINKANQQKLFNLGTNYTSPGTNDEKGTGLGLILCKEFVNKHGGDIWVESEEGKGSEFMFTLPLPVKVDDALI